MKNTYTLKNKSNFTVNKSLLTKELEDFKATYLQVSTAWKQLPDSLPAAGQLASEAIFSSLLVGEAPDKNAIITSIYRQMGLQLPPDAPTAEDECAEGIVALLMNVKRERAHPVTKEFLLRLHRELFPGDTTAGAFRTQPIDPKSTDAKKREIPSKTTPPENPEEVLSILLDILNTSTTSADPIEDIAIRASLIYLCFAAIQPFDVGTRRIGRALALKTLNEAFDETLFIPLSPYIAVSDKKRYFNALKNPSKRLNRTAWAKLFIPILTNALKNVLLKIQFEITKIEYLSRWRDKLPKREFKVLEIFLSNGMAVFETGLTTRMYVKLSGVSRATAERDILHMNALGAVISFGGGRSVHYIPAFFDD